VYEIGITSEGRRRCNHERGSRRGEEQSFHDIILSFEPDAFLVRRLASGKSIGSATA
jgi:hypothetical protein